MRAFGSTVLAVAMLTAFAAPVVAPHTSADAFPGLLNAPPTRVHVRDAGGRWHAPFIYRWTRIDQLEQRYEEDRSAGVPLVWGRAGHVVASSDNELAPLLLLGADSYGRDVFSRLVFGARISLGLAALAAFGAMALGVLLGGVAGYAGGFLDDLLMRVSDVMVVLPAAYVVLALRAVLPLVLAPSTIFFLLAIIFAIVGTPTVARGVRAIVRAERRLDYATAVTSLGASHFRVLARHLLPASRGFLAVQITALVPAFIVAEATLSYVNLGFPAWIATWGTMLYDVSSVRAFADFPWLLSPGVAIFLVALALNVLLQGPGASLLAAPIALRGTRRAADRLLASDSASRSTGVKTHRDGDSRTARLQSNR